MNVSRSINHMFSQNPFVLSTHFFSYTSLTFYFLLFLNTYLIALSCFASLYNHLFIYLTRIHSDEGLQSETSFSKFFSLRTKICKTVSLETPTQHSIYDIYFHQIWKTDIHHFNRLSENRPNLV